MIEIVLLKVTLLLALTWPLTWTLRGRSAATRHFVWCAALFGALAIAVVERTAPPVKVRMPARAVMAPSVPITAPVLNVGRASAHPLAPEGRAEARPTWSMLYAGGVILVLLWRAFGHLALARVTRRAEGADGFRLSEEVSAPVTWGWRRPVILLPTEAKEWPAERVEAALLHERAHIARADWLTQTLAQLVAALYWFHPLVWVAMGRLRAESEHACDDQVLAKGMTAPDYASHLLAVAQGALLRRHGARTGVAMARPSQFESRLVAVLDETRSRGRVARRIAFAAAMVIGVVLVPIVFARDVIRKNERPSSAVNHSVRAAPGETLTLDLKTGASIDITGWDEPRVDVAVLFRDDDAQEARVDVERVASGVRVHSYQVSKRSNGTSLRMHILAPRRSSLKLQSAGGDVHLTGLEGTFRGSTGGGEIVLDGLRGTADLSTGGGEVRVTDSYLEGDVTTGGGEVNIIRSHLVNGVSGNPSKAKSKDRIEKSGGDVVLSDIHDKSVTTGGGDIEIRRGSGLIQASTGGGNVRLREMSGSVEASTGAGNVEVTVIEGDEEQNVDITTGSGSVVVELPASFDGALDLETSYTASFGRETRIVSDFAVNRDGPGAWDSSRGTPRRIITARGTAGNGRGVVRIRAINGDVTVRKR
jgi:DUF4097 and DUF4098 domain-containing protein YvlB